MKRGKQTESYGLKGYSILFKSEEEASEFLRILREKLPLDLNYSWIKNRISFWNHFDEVKEEEKVFKRIGEFGYEEDKRLPR